MSVDDQRDLEIEALALLLHGAVNSSTGLGASAVKGLYAEPMSLEMITRASLPALCIYRTSDDNERLGSTEILETVTVTVDLFLQPTNVQSGQRSKRWPALTAAWKTIKLALLAGHHAEVEDDARILDIADITVDRESFKARTFGIAPGGAESYPWFRGTFTFDHVLTGAVNTSLVRLTGMTTIFDWFPDLPAEGEGETENNVEFTGPWPL